MSNQIMPIEVFKDFMRKYDAPPPSSPLTSEERELLWASIFASAEKLYTVELKEPVK